MRRLGQFEDFGSFDFGSYDAGSLDFGTFDTSSFDFGTFDTTALDTSAFDTTALDTSAFDTTAVDAGYDWGTYDPTASDWTQDFSTDAFADSNFGLDPWTETMNVDSGNIGLDVPEPTSAEIASETGSSIGEVANYQLEFPDVSLSDVFKFAQQGLTLYKAFQQAQATPTRTTTTGTRTVYDPATGRFVQVPTTGTTATSTTQRRTVTDPATGKQITVQWNPTTGKWERVPSEWITGVPNWALIAGGAAVALMLLGKRKRGG
jgi:hypothetical protein